MITEDINTFIQEDDIAVVLRPVKDKDGNWTGEVSVALANCITEETTLSAEDRMNMLTMGAMTASSFPIMMQNDDVFVMLQEYALAAMPELDTEHELEEEEAVEVERSGNVYRLSFNSKTEGSA